MTRKAIMLMLLAVAIMAAAEGDVEQEAIEALSTIESPTGDSLEGHWDCWFEHHNLEWIAKENDGFAPIRCAVALFYQATILEFLPDSKGWMLAMYTEDTTNQDFDRDAAFRIEGSDRFYSRAGELRWNIEKRTLEFRSGHSFSSVLHVQTTIDEWFGLEVLNENVFRLGANSKANRPILRLLFRTGTEDARKMVEFRDCIVRNDGRNLFDVEPCELPIPAHQQGRARYGGGPPR